MELVLLQPALYDGVSEHKAVGDMECAETVIAKTLSITHPNFKATKLQHTKAPQQRHDTSRVQYAQAATYGVQRASVAVRFARA